jgi:hypothetical protein
VIRLSGRVEYLDGRVEPFSTGTAALMAYERYAVRNGLPVGSDAPPMTMAHVVAWHAVAAEGVGFDTWVATVEGVELDEDAEIPPTLRAASGE